MDGTPPNPSSNRNNNHQQHPHDLNPPSFSRGLLHEDETSAMTNDGPTSILTKSQKPSMSYFRMSRATTEPDFAEDSEDFTDPLLEDDLESTLLMEHHQRQQQKQQQLQQLPHYHQQHPHDLFNSNTTPHHGRLGWIRQPTFWLIRKIGNLLAAMTFLAMLIGIPLVTYDALQNRRVDLAAVDSAAVMVLGTVILSTRLVYLHLTHWYMPDVQKYVVRILWMVPLYAIQSWLSLRFHHVRIYFDTARDLYEAYVIASFLYYLIELLGGQDHLVQMLQAKQVHDQQHHHLGQHVFPLNLVLQPWEMGMEFMMQCKHGVLQYVVLKAVSTFVIFACESLGLYGEGEFEWNRAYPYLSFILNVSVMYALYCLVKLFHAVNDELRYPRDWHPLGKFLAVKGVVFFTWWQGIIIFYLRAHGIIRNVGSWTGEEVANGLIDYCICIEMVLFAIGHYYVFTWKEYLPTSQLPPTSQQQQQETAARSQQNNRHQLDDVIVDENDLEALLLQSHHYSPNNSALSARAGGRRMTEQHAKQEPRRHAAAAAAASASAIGSANDATGSDTNNNKPPYKPPTVLSHPMKFRDALWSSTVPQETLHDIRRLRKGVDTVIQQTQAPGAIGLIDMQSSSSSSSAGGNTSQALVPPTTLRSTSSSSSVLLSAAAAPTTLRFTSSLSSVHASTVAANPDHHDSSGPTSDPQTVDKGEQA
jgi:hypothetical protein